MHETPNYPVISPSSGGDLHNIEHMDTADLVLFMAGNQFMVMQEMLEAFQASYPEVKTIFYETLPPGLLLKQILAGGALYNNKTITGNPDVYTAVSKHAMLMLQKRELIDTFSVYLHNRLALMVNEGNPKGITEIIDLAEDAIRVSQPGELEDITKYIKTMYTLAGGEKLAYRIMEEKRAEGTTLLTTVHHRETPLRLDKGTVDVGPVWITEALHAKRIGKPVDIVDLDQQYDQHDSVKYYAAILKHAPNRDNAIKFAQFLFTDTARSIYLAHGFVPA